ncbi:hypothetical protein AMTRI_Chr10g1590 [Amborella trichopoda]
MKRLFLVPFLSLIVSQAFASDPSPLQDFCVADNNSQHFFFPGLDKPGNTSNPLGSKVTPVFVMQLLGLNTLGVSIARIDFAPGGQNPPNTHPRAAEILTVLEGTLYVGFVTSNPDNRLISRTLKKGDVLAIPQGFIHFQQNVANAMFGANPPISNAVHAKAFQIDKKLVDKLQSSFWMDNKQLLGQ